MSCFIFGKHKYIYKIDKDNVSSRFDKNDDSSVYWQLHTSEECLRVTEKIQIKPVTFSRITSSGTRVGVKQNFLHQRLWNRRTGKQRNKLLGLRPRANYIGRATAACRQLLRIVGVAWSAQWIPRPYYRISRPEPLLFLPSSSSIVHTRLSGPRSRPIASQKIW
jgi:hypothetical protein